MREREHRVGCITSIFTGRTPLGMAYAHVCRGSEVERTYRGITRRGARRRAVRSLGVAR